MKLKQMECACSSKKNGATSLLYFLAASFFLACPSAAALAQEAGEQAAEASSRGFLDPAGPVAAAQLSHFGTINWIMMIAVVPVFIAVPLILLRYRRGGRGTYKPKWDFNVGIEIIIWVVPILIVIALSVALWSHTTKFDPYKPLGKDPLQIEVISLDWKFLFLYPEQGIATVNLLAIPENRPVTLTLTSATSMQSIMIPQLAGQIFMMAGMSTKLNLLADRPGVFVGRNMQYNGPGFHKQSFRTESMTDEAFNNWVNTARAAANPLDWQGYETLAKPATVEKPVLYSAFDPTLFRKVITSFAPDWTGADDRTSTSQHSHSSHSAIGANQ